MATQAPFSTQNQAFPPDESKLMFQPDAKNRTLHAFTGAIFGDSAPGTTELLQEPDHMKQSIQGRLEPFAPQQSSSQKPASLSQVSQEASEKLWPRIADNSKTCTMSKNRDQRGTCESPWRHKYWEQSSLFFISLLSSSRRR